VQLTDLPDPVPGRGEVAIEIRALGCNFFDILMIQGRYQVRPPLRA
jgi:NADPH2:quinone reductase